MIQSKNNLEGSRKMYSWAPKGSWIFGAFAFYLLLIFSLSEYKIRFLDWSSGILISGFVSIFILLRRRIAKKEAYTILLPLLWTFFALIITPFAIDISLHLEKLSLSITFNIIAAFTIITVFSRQHLYPQAITITTSSWIILNLCFFLLWSNGSYEYKAGNFSGILRNRNEFAIQTISLLSMMLFFARGNFLKGFLIAVGGIMILATLSLKGFLFFFFVLFYPLYLSSGLRRRVIAIATGTIVVIAAYLLLPSIQQRINSVAVAFYNPTELDASQSALLRMWLAVEGLKVASENPITGVGVDNSRLVLIPPGLEARGEEEGFYSHNNYIEMLLNAGVAGLILYYVPILYMFFSVKRRHPYYKAIKTLSAFLLLAGFGMVQYNNFSMTILYATVIFLKLYYTDLQSNITAKRPGYHTIPDSVEIG
ncbi:O-antigen ligase family protein [Pelagicoccus sp. SDUM812002]|uniref:O-antigen ligase family protein n=1 Tax=Pelagicoccus sp. SDUM812002 TaxID=3041266 RepID=UPI00280CDF10|nr:O-antigen ligase family protein [Pelagicoccus sp. SDUM812002]MDQ8186292.1 O-antigen ligase family protein [Pelagicoccus sp. SDUM812002]